MSDTFYGQTIVLYMTISEVICLFLISSYSHLSLMGLVYNILIVLGIFVTVKVFKMVKDKVGDRYTTLKVNSFFNLESRFALAIMFIFATIFYMLNYDVVLGAYLAGITLAIVLKKSEKEVIHKQLDTIGFGFFIPLFFIITGSNLNIPAVFSSWNVIVLIPCLFGLMFLAKFIPAFLFTKVFGKKLAMHTGSLLAAQFSLLLIGSAIALENHIIDETFYSALVVTALISSLVLPVIFLKFINKNKQKLNLDSPAVSTSM
ncbi:cation:proton antiporter [Oscillospiraceae bacterium WX1]